VLPGSDSLQLAMFTGYRVAGLPGAGAALLGSILPPTVLILGAVAVLHRLRREAWVSRFVEGLTPAVAVLMIYVAMKLVAGSIHGALDWGLIALGVASAAAFAFDVAPPLVLLSAGILGILLFR
jgi:chromate transporter